MKKIFAFVLATIMVLSLVPASAFAAITKCPATHTSTNCDCTQVGSPVPATCEKAGYTEYVCNTCGESFVDNLKPKAKHTWVSNPEKAAGDIPASCVYGVNGIQYLICSVCGDEYGDDGYKTIDYNSTSVHDLVHVSGVGCEKLYACTLCGAEGYINSDDILTTEEAHNWEFTEVETEPYWSKGTKYSGMAIFTCKDCGAVKKVVVDTPVCHDSSKEDAPEDYTVVSAAKDPTCTKKGSYLVVKHADCGELWFCTETYCASKHTEYEDHTWANADHDNDGDWKDTKTGNTTIGTDWSGANVKLNEITALGHLVSKFISDRYDAGVKNCGDVYLCERCSTHVTQGHREGTATYYQKRTCTAKGLYVTTCKDCGQYVYGSKGAYGHSTAEKIIPATCVSSALKITYCTRGDGTCTITKTLVGNEYYYLTKTPEPLGNINSKNHDWAEDASQNVQLGNVNPDIYCSGMSYTFKICKNGCAQYGSGYTELNQPVMHNFVPYKTVHNYMTPNLVVEGAVLPQWTTRSWVKCTNPNCTNPIPKVPYTDVPDASLKNEFANETEALEYHGIIATYWTVNAKGEKVVDITKGDKGYEGVGSYYGMSVDQIKTLVFGTPVPGLSTGATCSTPAKNVFLCKDCNTYVWVQGGTAAHALTNYKPGKKATCTTAGSYDTYTCTVCKVTYWFDAAGEVHTESAVKMPCSDTLDPVVGSCGEENGYYQCRICKTCYSDATATTEYVPTLHNYVTVLAGVAATCNTTGYPEIRYCADCGVSEINLIYVNGGKEIRINFNNNGVAVLNTTYLSGEVRVTLNADGTATYYYDGEDWSEWPTYATVKKMEDKYTHRGIYVNATGKLATNTALPYASTEVSLQNSETPKNYKYSVLDHSKPSFNLVSCEACVYEFVRDYFAAKGGHINADGELIDVDGCNDDPVCIICKQYAAEHPDEDVQYTFGAHDYVVTGESTATCSTAGYVAERCIKCGEYNITGEIVETVKAKTWHNNLLKGAYKDAGYMPVLVGVERDYANNGSGYLACPVCKANLKDLDATACPGAGLEIYLSTDAESYIPGSKVYVTVTLDSLKGVKVWGLNFPVLYNADVFAFTGYEFNTADSEFQTFAANEVPGGYKLLADNEDPFRGYYGPVTKGTIAPSGIISIIANADDEVLVKGEQTLVVLEFAVISAAAAEDECFEIAATSHTLGAKLEAIQSDINPGYYKVVTAEGSKPQKFTIDVINGAGKAVPAVFAEKDQAQSNKSNLVEVTEFLDVDGKNGRTMKDAYEIYYLIYKNAYDVKADADFDGYVTAKDLSILYHLLTGVTTVEDIVIPTTSGDELPPEGTIMPR